MESLIIPGIIAGILGILLLIRKFTKSYDARDIIEFINFFLIAALILALMICPTLRNIVSRGDAIVAQSYYTNIVEPHIVAEFDEYVVVDSEIAPAVWQAGDFNLSEYNSYLATNYYWDANPIIGSLVYPAPSELKFVRVQGEVK